VEHWWMNAHGKAIELTSGRWKEIWLRGSVLVRLPPVGLARFTHAVHLSLLETLWLRYLRFQAPSTLEVCQRSL